MRLDRWVRRHYPQLNHVALQKLLRAGQFRVDGKRVKVRASMRSLPPQADPAPLEEDRGPGDPPAARATNACSLLVLVGSGSRANSASIRCATASNWSGSATLTLNCVTTPCFFAYAFR